jgi:hypothetical protein
LGVVALVLASAIASHAFWLPLLLTAVFGAIQFSFDIDGKGRSFLPEVSGAAAMAFLSTAIAMAAGMPGGKPWLLALCIGLQAATAISYAGTRVRLARGVEVSKWPVWIGHIVALAIVGSVAASGLLAWPIVAAFTVLAGRAVWGVSCHRKPIRAAMVGVQEVCYALLTVLALVAS